VNNKRAFCFYLSPLSRLSAFSSFWAFPLIEAGGLSAHTTQALATANAKAAALPVSAPIPNAEKIQLIIKALYFF
jgi:hypothetical protein